MDPITAVSSVGAVIGIIDVITKSINGLREVGARYKDAEFAVAALVSQLTTLRVALTKIREWMDSEPVESHYQLVMDLGDTLSFCGILTDKLESEVLRCNRLTGGMLKARSKLKFAVGGRSIEDLQKMVLQQTNALNLVISACHILSTSEQRTFLESPSNRQVFSATKDDVSSLYVHRDSASIATMLTDRLSLFSRQFAFDRELWASKVYKDASPRLLEVIRGRARQRADQKELELQRSRSIDRTQKQDAIAVERARVLLLSTATELGPAFMKAFRSPWVRRGKLSDQELKRLRLVIRQAAASLMIQAAGFAQRADAMPPAVEDAAARLLASTNSDLLSAEAAESLIRLWEDTGFQRERSRAETDGAGLPSSADYAVENIVRIIADDYFPTLEDALQAWACPKALDETVFDLRGPRSLPLKICSVGSQMLRSREWMEELAPGADMIVFLVDVAGYNRYLADLDTNEMMDAMAQFDLIVNSRMCSGAYPVVWFSNSRLFDSKAERFPMKDWYPDYTGGPNFGEAVEYFTSRFRDLYRGGKDFFAKSIEPEDNRFVDELVSVLKQVMLRETLRFTGFIY